MVYSLIISKHAEEQLDDIIRYVAMDLNNPGAAARILDDFETAYNDLAAFAGVFPICQDPYLSSKEYHKYLLQHHDYLILYRINGNSVEVSGIFHTRENYAERL